jgi:hypothetical protein
MLKVLPRRPSATEEATPASDPSPSGQPAARITPRPAGGMPAPRRRPAPADAGLPLSAPKGQRG